MGWLDDAEKKLKEIEGKEDNSVNEDIIELKTEAQKEALRKELRKEYDNATMREIEKAIDVCMDKVEEPRNKKEFMRCLRVKLED